MSIQGYAPNNELKELFQEYNEVIGAEIVSMDVNYNTYGDYYVNPAAGGQINLALKAINAYEGAKLFDPHKAYHWSDGSQVFALNHALRLLIDSKSSSSQIVLNDLLDVVLTDPLSGEVLKFDGTNWVNNTDNIGGGGTGLQPWEIADTNMIAENGNRIMANTSTGSFIVTLPFTPAFGDEVQIRDANDSFAVFGLTLNRNGSMIESLHEDLFLDLEAINITLIFRGSTIGWNINT